MDTKNRRYEDEQECNDIDVVVVYQWHCRSIKTKPNSQRLRGICFLILVFHTFLVIEKTASGSAENIVRTGVI